MSTQSFRDMVVDNMEPLVRGYGFSFCTIEEFYVKLESEFVAIGVQYDQSRAYELSFVISFKLFEKRAGNIPFNLGEVFREFNVPEAGPRSYIQSASMERIALFTRDVCGALMEFCVPVLKGELLAFENLLARRATESKHYTLGLRLTCIRNDADAAWRAKDYAKYQNLLTGLESVLSAADKKKLELARQFIH